MKRYSPSGAAIKDLSVIKRPLEEILLVDNSMESFRLFPDNGVPITDYFHDKTDQALICLQVFLEPLIDVDDVTVHLKTKFGIRTFLEEVDRIRQKKT